MKVSLEKVSNLAVIAVAVVVIGFKVQERFFPPRKQAPVSSSVGKPLSLREDRTTAKHPSIVFFLSKSCHFCTESMGFYRRLAELRNRSGKCELRLLAIGPEGRETVDDIRAYLTKNDLQVDAIHTAPFINLGVSATPTLVVRDAAGIVKSVWIGRLSDKVENEVFDKLKPYCQS